MDYSYLISTKTQPSPLIAVHKNVENLRSKIFDGDNSVFIASQNYWVWKPAGLQKRTVQSTFLNTNFTKPIDGNSRSLEENDTSIDVGGHSRNTKRSVLLELSRKEIKFGGMQRGIFRIKYEKEGIRYSKADRPFCEMDVYWVNAKTP